MTKIALVGVAAAVLLASAPVMAQEKVEEPAEAPEATVANEVSQPAADVVTEESTATEASDAASEVMAAAAEAVVCKRGKTERHVNVVAPGSQGRLCEVHYAKPTEGVEDRVLWYATSDKSFCDERANNLMARLASAGFACVNPDGTPVNIEAAATVEPSADTISAPESAPEGAPAAVESDHPANPEEPADAPEAPEAPAEDGDQEN